MTHLAIAKMMMDLIATDHDNLSDITEMKIHCARCEWYWNVRDHRSFGAYLNHLRTKCKLKMETS